MRKAFVVGNMDAVQKIASTLDSSQIIASRVRDKVWIQNLDLGAGVTIQKSEDGSEVTIKFSLKDGDFLCMGDSKGIADKRFL